MKLKSKLILAATAGLILSGAAAGTSAFAWYTANRQVSVSLSSMTATSSSANLAVYLSNGNSDVTATGHDTAATAAASITVTSENTLTDASSAGNGTFEKPKLDAVGSAIVGWYTEASYLPATVKWYHKYELTFINTGVTGENLFLSQKTAADSVVSDTTGTVANSVRYSFKAADATGYTFVNPKGASAENIYLPSTATATSETTAVTPTLVINSNYFGQTADITSNPATLSTYNGYIGNIAASSTLAVTFYVWIEGTDGNTIAANLVNGGGAFSLITDFFTLAA